MSENTGASAEPATGISAEEREVLEALVRAWTERKVAMAIRGLFDTLEEAVRELGRAREALRQYGTHTTFCATDREPSMSCDCGYQAHQDALGQEEAEAGLGQAREALVVFGAEERETLRMLPSAEWHPKTLYALANRLLDALEEAERQRDAWSSSSCWYSRSKHADHVLVEAENKNLQRRAETAEAKLGQAREALSTYGDHTPFCATDREPLVECDCGFRAAVAQARAALGQEASDG